MEIPVLKNNDVDSDSSPWSDKNKLSWFKYLGGSTEKEWVNATRETKVAHDLSSNGEPGADTDCEAILNGENSGNKGDSCDVESNLFSRNEAGMEKVLKRESQGGKARVERS
ncbi:hypothetical protein HOY80DRAFT_1033697 [Tuber brumale]|nr:hypothetical protein HOY80DRAFT_1033697 [Tuber brumale]